MKKYTVIVIDKFTRIPLCAYGVEAISKWHAKLILSREIRPKKNGFFLVVKSGE